MKSSDPVDARKSPVRGREALALLEGLDEVVVARGAKVVRQPLGKLHPGDDAMLKLLLGPTGNLRAPTVRVGRKLVVGFADAMYRDLLDA